MAETSFYQDKFSCSVCLDVLKDPMTIPCGHNYCMSCITDCWNQDDQKGVYSCPVCRQTFTPRPALFKNAMLTEMVEELKKTKPQTAHPAHCGGGHVECDICSGTKYKAVKSCLECQKSYCHDHLEQHDKFFQPNKHNLMDPTRRLHEMICLKHNKQLEIYCRTDQQCICYPCLMDEHKNHNTVTVVAERTEKQRLLKKTQEKFQQRIQERENELQELRKAVDSYKCSAKTVMEDNERIFTGLFCSIKRIHSEVTQLIRDQERAAVSQAEGLLKQLEQETDDLRRRDAELEQLSHMDNDFYFLQSFQSLPAAPESTVSRRFTVSSFLSFDDVRKSVSQLKEKLEESCREEIENISDRVKYITIISDGPKTRKEFLQYSSQFTLDSNTVFKHLHLSEENTAVTYTDTDQQYPDHPERFDHWMQVLCQESVCGRCYWEVEWSGSNGVLISVSYRSISRKGEGVECGFGYNNQSWRLFCSPFIYSFRHNSKRSEISVPSSCSRIGVFVDHNVGTLSFYSISDTMALIHRVQTTFTQPLCPGFGVSKGSTLKVCHLTK